MSDLIYKVTNRGIKEGVEKGNVKPPSNTSKPVIKPAPQKPAGNKAK